MEPFEDVKFSTLSKVLENYSLIKKYGVYIYNIHIIILLKVWNFGCEIWILFGIGG